MSVSYAKEDVEGVSELGDPSLRRIRTLIDHDRSDLDGLIDATPVTQRCRECT